MQKNRRPSGRRNLINYQKEYTVNKPIRVLYTGNLMIGRFEIIKEISRAFEKVNKDSVKIVLDVYTQTQIEKNEIEQLTPQVRIHDPVTTEKVLELQQNADILLFAEALSGSQRLIARLSFSTKLTDYFRSGKYYIWQFPERIEKNVHRRYNI